LVTDRLEPRVAPRLPEAVPLFVVPHQRIEQLVGFNFHRGVLACGRRHAWPEPSEWARGAGAGSVVVVCPRIDNPENLGAVVRLADVFGALGVLAGPRCPDPLSRRVLRVSMGSALRVPVTATDDLAAEVDRLRRDHGFATVATVTDPSAERLDGFRRSDRLALFLGSEGHGLEPAWLALCDRRLTIPMRPGAGSLNVAVAAGIILHHLLGPRPADVLGPPPVDPPGT
jgi:tRNA G18 (ribose-2'-O)-methylase SpoU